MPVLRPPDFNSFHNPSGVLKVKALLCEWAVNISHRPFTSFTRDAEVTELSSFFFNQEKKRLKKTNDSSGINDIRCCSGTYLITPAMQNTNHVMPDVKSLPRYVFSRGHPVVFLIARKPHCVSCLTPYP
jgi:hypothetical protein